MPLVLWNHRGGDVPAPGDVVLTGQVGGALPADVFAGNGAAEPLPEVQIQEIPAVGTGQTVEVTGTVKKTLSAVTVEEELEVAPAGEPHLTATRVEIVERWVPPAAAGVERIIRHETCPAPGDPAGRGHVAPWRHTMTPHNQHPARTAVASVLVAAGLALTGCGPDEPAPGTEAEGTTEGDMLESPPPAAEATGDNPDVGPYDQEFYDELAAGSGEQVALTAEVDHIISTSALTVADPDDQMLDALLVVHGLDLPELGEGRLVEVTGTVQESFEITAAEEELGADLDAALFESHVGEPYVQATDITAVPQE